MNYTDAWRNNSQAETLWDNNNADILVLAPHGGDIEFGTDDCASRIHKKLIQKGYNPVTWMYHAFGENAYDEHHVTSTKISSDDFPKLNEVEDRVFDLAVSIHMHEEGYVGVGGGIGDRIREFLADSLSERLPDSKEVRFEYDSMKYKGRKSSNIVNRFTLEQRYGIQLELTPKTAFIYRKRVARSVVDTVTELL